MLLPEVENFLIFLNNLSNVYVFTVVVLLVAVVITIYLTRESFRFLHSKRKAFLNEKHKKNDDADIENDENDAEVEEDGSDDELNPSNFGLVSKLKTARLRAYEELLTEDQKKAEKEIEKAQLAAIYDLLKHQEKDFSADHAMGEEDLKEQLNLYR